MTPIVILPKDKSVEQENARSAIRLLIERVSFSSGATEWLNLPPLTVAGPAMVVLIDFWNLHLASIGCAWFLMCAPG